MRKNVVGHDLVVVDNRGLANDLTADLDIGPAGSGFSNPHLKKASQDVEQAMLSLAMS